MSEEHDARLLWDFDNDGNFSEPEEDITSRVISLECIAGRNWPSLIHGRVTPGVLRALLNNDDGRFSFFNKDSPLQQGDFSLLSGRKLRVRIGPDPNNGVDPELIVRDEFMYDDHTVLDDTSLWTEHGDDDIIILDNKAFPGSTELGWSRPYIRDHTGGQGDGSTFTASSPSALPGDIIVAFQASDITSDMTEPSGGPWTLTFSDNTHGGNRIWRKQSDGNEPSSYTFNQSSSGDGVVHVISVANAPDAPLTVDINNPGGSDFSVVTPGVTIDDDHPDTLEIRFPVIESLGTSDDQHWTFVNAFFIDSGGVRKDTRQSRQWIATGLFPRMIPPGIHSPGQAHSLSTDGSSRRGITALIDGAVSPLVRTLATVDTELTDVYAQATFGNPGRVTDRIDTDTMVGVVVRYTDDDNWIDMVVRLGDEGFVLCELRECSAGTVSILNTTNIPRYRPTTVGLLTDGSTVSGYIEGVEIFSETTAVTTGTRTGIRMEYDRRAVRPHCEEFFVWDGLPGEDEDILWTGEVQEVLPLSTPGPMNVANLVGVGILHKGSIPSARGPWRAEGDHAGILIGQSLASSKLIHPPSKLDRGTQHTGPVAFDMESTLDIARAVEGAELGLLYESKEGYVNFLDRNSRDLIVDPAAVFSDEPDAELDYSTIEPQDWLREIVNRAAPSFRPGPPAVTFHSEHRVSSFNANNELTVSVPIVQPDELLLVFVAVGNAVTSNGDEQEWVTPSEWIDLSGQTTRVGPNNEDDLRTLTRVLAFTADKVTPAHTVTLAVTNVDKSVDGTASIIVMKVNNWFGDIGNGVAISDWSISGDTSDDNHVQSGRLGTPWGAAVPTLLIASAFGVSRSDSLGNPGLQPAPGPPAGYWSLSSVSGHDEITTHAGNRKAHSIVATAIDIRSTAIVFGTLWPRGIFRPCAGRFAAVIGIRAREPVTTSFTNVDSVQKHNAIRPHRNPVDFFRDQLSVNLYGSRITSQFGRPNPIVRLSYWANKSEAHKQQAVQRRLSDRITLVAKHSSKLGIDQDFFIESVGHTFREGMTSWKTTYELSPAVALIEFLTAVHDGSPPGESSVDALTFELPGELLPGDFMLVLFTASDVEDWTAPAGWTREFTDQSGEPATWVYTRIAGFHEPEDYTWSRSSSTSWAHGTLYIFRGARRLSFEHELDTSPTATEDTPTIELTEPPALPIYHRLIWNDNPDLTDIEATDTDIRPLHDMMETGTSTGDNYYYRTWMSNVRPLPQTVQGIETQAVGDLELLREHRYTFLLHRDEALPEVVLIGTDTDGIGAGPSAINEITLDVPSTAEPGDLLIAVIVTGLASITPSGWTRFNDTLDSNPRVTVYTRTVVEGEPSSHTFTGQSSITFHGVLTAWRAVNGETLSPAVNTATAGSAVTVDTPDINLLRPPARAVYFRVINEDDTGTTDITTSAGHASPIIDTQITGSNFGPTLYRMFMSDVMFNDSGTVFGIETTAVNAVDIFNSRLFTLLIAVS